MKKHYMNKMAPKLKGFTLLEVLIATSIFVVVMIFTLGTVGQNVGFEAKLKNDKSVTTTAQNTTDLISRDIRAVKSTAKITLGTDSRQFDGGLATMECLLGCNFKYNTIPAVPNFSDASDLGSNVLVVAVENSYKIYGSKNGGVYYLETPFISLKDGVLTTPDIIKVFDSSNQINTKATETKIVFAGFAPDNTVSAKQQPYVQLLIESKTANYDKLLPRDRAIIDIRTLVESRHY